MSKKIYKIGVPCIFAALFCVVAFGVYGLSSMDKSLAKENAKIAFAKAYSDFVESDKAPNFKVELSDGKQVSLSDYKGKYLFLHFWATWCGPCRKELPELQQFYQSLSPSSNIQFLAICISDTKKSMDSFMKKNKFTFPTALDESGFLVAFPYDVQAIPVSIIINPEGKIEKQVIGMMSPKALENFVKDYVN